MSFEEFSENSEVEFNNSAKAVRDTISYELNVSQPQVFLKAIAIHTGTAAITLSVCPQFGLNPLGTSSLNLFEAFMYFGHSVCSVLCGLFFIGMSLFSTQLLLSFDEWRVFQQNNWKLSAGLVATSLIAFAFLNADFNALYIEYWLAGTALAIFLLQQLNLRPVFIKEKA